MIASTPHTKPKAASASSNQTSTIQFTQLISSLMIPASMPANSYYDWFALDKEPYIQWAPLPPMMLSKPTAEGHYFRRNGLARIGNQTWKVYAAGAITMVMSHNFLYEGVPLGENTLVGALKQPGYTAKRHVYSNTQCECAKMVQTESDWKATGFFGVIPAGCESQTLGSL